MCLLRADCSRVVIIQYPWLTATRRTQKPVGADDLAKRKRSGNRGVRKSPAKTGPSIGAPVAVAKPPNEESSGADTTNKRSEAQKPQGEWVTFEHRDADGNPTLAKELIQGTYSRRYRDVPQGTQIKILVLAGYKPKALMLVERKIYEVHRLSMQGWRRNGQIVVEMEGWRQHEADWFNAMGGTRLDISDPALPGLHNEKSEYVVSKSSFQRKIVKFVDEKRSKAEVQMYEGTLDFTETWKSAWRRQKAEILNMGFKYLLLPLLTALVSGLAVWWIVSSPSPAVRDPEARGNPGEQGVQTGTGESATEPSDDSANRKSPNVPVRQTDPDKKTSNDNTPKGDASTQTSIHNGDE